jgi:hypothetical protein
MNRNPEAQRTRRKKQRKWQRNVGQRNVEAPRWRGRIGFQPVSRQRKANESRAASVAAVCNRHASSKRGGAEHAEEDAGKI